MKGTIIPCNLICGIGRFAYATAGRGQPRVSTSDDWIGEKGKNGDQQAAMFWVVLPDRSRLSFSGALEETVSKEFIELRAILWIMAPLANNQAGEAFHHERHHGKQPREQLQEFI